MDQRGSAEYEARPTSLPVAGWAAIAARLEAAAMSVPAQRGEIAA